MRAVAMVFCMVCAAVLQALLPNPLWLGRAGTPVLLGVVLYYALAHDRALMLGAAIAAGVLQDALGLIPLGYSSICFCGAALSVHHFHEAVFGRQWITHSFFGMLSAGAVTLVLSLMLRSGEGLPIGLGFVLWKTFGAMALGAVCTPLVYRAVEGLDRMLGNVEEREA